MSVWMDIHKESTGAVDRKEDIGVFIDTDRMPVDKMADKIAKMMKDGIVHFEYMKKDVIKKNGTVIRGTKREAWGTKFMEIVDKIPHGGDCPPKRAGYTIYFDVEKGDWRAYLDSNVVGFYNDVYTYPEYERISK